MRYTATTHKRALLISFQNRVDYEQQPLLVTAIGVLTDNLATLFHSQGAFLANLKAGLKRVINDTNWTHEKFLSFVETNIRRGTSEEETKTKVSDALITLRQLFDGDENFFTTKFFSITAGQIAIFRQLMREIIVNHISAVIGAIDKELTKQQGIFRVPSAPPSAPQPVASDNMAIPTR